MVRDARSGLADAEAMLAVYRERQVRSLVGGLIAHRGERLPRIIHTKRITTKEQPLLTRGAKRGTKRGTFLKRLFETCDFV